MSAPYHILGRWDADVLIIADHASNHVPPGIDLGIDPALLNDHIALDIGVAGVAAAMVEMGADMGADGGASMGGCCAILGGVSRLVIDYNREPDAAGLVPLTSDGLAIPGNADADVAGRVAQFYDPYHHMLAQLTAMAHRPFILSLHSFTPWLRSEPDRLRPWHIGVLYNAEVRVAPLAIAYLESLGRIVGDQLPYSGRLLNATMNRHAEAHGRPYLGIEVRQSLIRNAAGQRAIAADLLDTVAHVRNVLRNRGD